MKIVICPSVSIVIPVYNVAPYMERCLQSVMQQTHPATECIIVDDASTDDSIARCERLLNKYTGPTRFVIVYHHHNRGLSAARNTGTNTATSDYIYYLDGDDEITPDCIEKLVAPTVHDDTIEMVMGAHRVNSTMKHFLGRWYTTQRTCFIKDMPTELQTNEEVCRWYYNEVRPVCVWNKLLKLSFIKDYQLFNKEGLLFEDSLWTFYLMCCLSHVVFIHDVTYFYHRNRFSICTTTTPKERNRHFGYTFKEMTDHIIHCERQKETARWVFLFCNCYIDSYDSPDYQRYYEIYRRELSDCKLKLTLYRLILIHFLSKSKGGRVLSKTIMRLIHLKRSFKDGIKIKMVK